MGSLSSLRCLGLAFAPLAAALAQPATPLDSPDQLDPLVVTAQKRGQSIDEVPISITAYTGTFLDQLGITGYADLAPFVPGLFASVQSPNTPSINLRGVGSDTTDPRHDPRISIFQDGVAISRTPGSHTEFFDLERVEVLKGPQGTLFGRSAGAGAISIISRKPTPDHSAALTFGLGNFNRQYASGFVNTPLVDDTLLARVAFTAESRDGFVENLADGSDLYSRETFAVRPSLRWLPTSDTNVDLIINVQRDTPAGTAFKSGVIPPAGGDTSPFTPAHLTRGAELGIERTVWGATALIEHRISDIWTLNAITAWRAYDAAEQLDIDGSALTILEASHDATAHQFSQEIRLNFDTGRRFAGFVGAAYARERAHEISGVFVDERSIWPFLSSTFRDGLLAAGVPDSILQTAVPAMHPLVPQTHLPAGFAAFAFVPSLAPLSALAGAPLKPLHSEAYITRAELDATDVFVDGTWRATDRFEFTAGARVSFEKQVGAYDAPPAANPSTLGFLLGNTPNLAVLPTPGLLSDSDHTTSWVGRAIARYVFNPSFNTYASVSRGRRPAALLISGTGSQRAGEESIVNTELGAKGRALNGRLDWSAAVFLYRYSHFQTQVQDPDNISRAIIMDAGRATGRGGELSLRSLISDHITAFATYGYTDATFEDTDDNGTPQIYAGSTFRLTSRHTASLGFTFEHRTSRWGRFAFTPVWQYRSDLYFDDDNTRLGGTLHQPGYALVNLRLAWSSLGRTWEAVLFADNVFDKEYLADAGNLGANLGLPTYIRGTPRLYGLNLTRRW
jgi:Outer membrane receptor proteins, mostly Fe transport